ncbi:hypothetical protein J5N97_028610 [Dioscorea zingiberensis]|uniref:AIPP2-like SPOC-like domain-containing protein n=1 Tax=Dioscorea zingiberensis TaxID=325984 RepID=A0A9D5BZU5_9LILI|nr:hypothetical protein J5N97_028610 [Dioscorea zingiberensis]
MEQYRVCSLLQHPLLSEKSPAMKGTEKRRADQVCNVCGDAGYAEFIATCCQCKQVLEHTYCMENNLAVVPETWTCEGCLAFPCVKHLKFKTIETISSDVKRLKPSDDIPSYKEIYRQLAHVGNLPSEARLMQPEQSHPSFMKPYPVKKRISVISHARQPLIGATSPNTIEKASEKSLPLQDVAAQTFGEKETGPNRIPILGASLARMDQHKIICSKSLNPCMALCQPKQENADANEEAWSLGKESLPALIKTESFEEDTYPQRRKSLDLTGYIESKNSADASPSDIKNVSCQSQIKKCTDILVGQLHVGGVRELPSEPASNFLSPDHSGNTIHLTSPEKNLPILVVSDGMRPNFSSAKTPWIGNLEIFGMVPHVYEGVEAHLPNKVCLLAYEQLKQIPTTVRFKLVHRLDVWPKLFQVDPPMVDDIGFFLFPCELQRSKEKYSQLLEQMNSGDLALQTRTGAVELLIFTSKELPKDSNFTEFPLQKFIWGVFRHLKPKKES